MKKVLISPHPEENVTPKLNNEKLYLFIWLIITENLYSFLNLSFYLGDVRSYIHIVILHKKIVSIPHLIFYFF